jgi:hypothetical protein
MGRITVTRAGGTSFDDGRDQKMVIDTDQISSVGVKHPEEVGNSVLIMKDGLRIPCQESADVLNGLLDDAQ